VVWPIAARTNDNGEASFGGFLLGERGEVESAESLSSLTKGCVAWKGAWVWHKKAGGKSSFSTKKGKSNGWDYEEDEKRKVCGIMTKAFGRRKKTR